MATRTRLFQPCLPPVFRGQVNAGGAQGALQLRDSQRDGKWLTAFCPEVPEANGQGKTPEECLESLASAIELVLVYRREQALEQAPKGAEETSVLV